MEDLNRTAWITSCKVRGDSWYVNEAMSVPNDPANRDCADVLAWIAEGNTPAPEFTDAEIAANAQAKVNSDSLAYLALTGWYVERLNDPSSGKAIPQDILDARAKARADVV